MSNYDPYSPFGNKPPERPENTPGKDEDSGNSVGEQYSFDNGSGYQPSPKEGSWPGTTPQTGQPAAPYVSPTQPQQFDHYGSPQNPNMPVSAQPVTGLPTSGQPMSGQPMSPGWQPGPQPMPQPMQQMQQPGHGYYPSQKQSNTSFMSAGRVWATVGIVVGVIVVVLILLCVIGFANAGSSISNR